MTYEEFATLLQSDLIMFANGDRWDWTGFDPREMWRTRELGFGPMFFLSGILRVPVPDCPAEESQITLERCGRFTKQARLNWAFLRLVKRRDADSFWLLLDVFVDYRAEHPEPRHEDEYEPYFAYEDSEYVFDVLIRNCIKHVEQSTLMSWLLRWDPASPAAVRGLFARLRGPFMLPEGALRAVMRKWLPDLCGTPTCDASYSWLYDASSAGTRYVDADAALSLVPKILLRCVDMTPDREIRQFVRALWPDRDQSRVQGMTVWLLRCRDRLEAVRARLCEDDVTNLIARRLNIACLSRIGPSA